MTLLYWDARFLEHDTGDHPECRERVLLAAQHLDSLMEGPAPLSWEPATTAQVTRVHASTYLDQLHRFAVHGGRIEHDTVVSRRSVDVALLAAGAACDAVRRVVAGEDHTAFCLTRPPGHHALPTAAMGFCLVNTVAVAARAAIQDLDIDRVLIVDWDVHHGNGTQATFWNDPQVGFLSIHRWPFYPGTGSSDETGAGPGLGTTRNVPVEFGTPRDEYLSRFAEGLHASARQLRPELILVSAGFDSHKRDPIGSLGLESEDFGSLTSLVRDVAATYAEDRIVSILEGGYDATALAESVAIHIATLSESTS